MKRLYLEAHITGTAGGLEMGTNANTGGWRPG